MSFLYANVTFSQSSSDVQSYIAKYKSIALQNEKDYGVPATITLAQGILESGAGTSSLTRNTNNHFGIKALGGWNGSVYYAWDDETCKSRFRCYKNAEDSYTDHARLLSTSRFYKHLLCISVYDYRKWAAGLKKAGYATAPNYAKALIGIIDSYKLYAINGGVKLRPGKTVVVTTYKEQTKPVFEVDCEMPETEMSEEQEIIQNSAKRYIVRINDCHCTTLNPGETLAYVARKHNVSITDLLKFNEVDVEAQITEGDIVFLEKKKRHYEGAQDYYIAQEDETLYEVSQQFGIQLHQLAKLNGLSGFVRLKPGKRIMLK